jgi:hypothetical protein
MIAAMKPGSVLVDIAIDQGGCAETSRPTTHSCPTYVEAGVVHYCVTNMPGAAARTATLALTAVTLPLALELADKGTRALLDHPGLRDGLNVCRPGRPSGGRRRPRLRLRAVRDRCTGGVVSQSLQSPTNVVFAPAAAAVENR